MNKRWFDKECRFKRCAIIYIYIYDMFYYRVIFFAIQIYVIFENQTDDVKLYGKSSHLCSGNVVCCFFVDY